MVYSIHNMTGLQRKQFGTDVMFAGFVSPHDEYTPTEDGRGVKKRRKKASSSVEVESETLRKTKNTFSSHISFNTLERMDSHLRQGGSIEDQRKRRNTKHETVFVPSSTGKLDMWEAYTKEALNAGKTGYSYPRFCQLWKSEVPWLRISRICEF
jgi:hypothetical protein